MRLDLRPCISSGRRTGATITSAVFALCVCTRACAMWTQADIFWRVGHLCLCTSGHPPRDTCFVRTDKNHLVGGLVVGERFGQNGYNSDIFACNLLGRAAVLAHVLAVPRDSSCTSFPSGRRCSEQLSPRRQRPRAGELSPIVTRCTPSRRRCIHPSISERTWPHDLHRCTSR